MSSAWRWSWSPCRCSSSGRRGSRLAEADGQAGMNLYSLFRSRFPADPDAPFLIEPDGTELSYAALDERTGVARRPARRAGRRPGRPGRDPGRRRASRACSSISPRFAPARSTCRSTRPIRRPRSAISSRIPSRPCSSAIPARGAAPRRTETLDGAGRSGAAGRSRLRGRGARAGRPRRHPLHLRHDRPLQGRDADPRQPRLQRRDAARGLAVHGAGTGCSTPCRSSTPTACSSPPT